MKNHASLSPLATLTVYAAAATKNTVMQEQHKKNYQKNIQVLLL